MKEMFVSLNKREAEIDNKIAEDAENEKAKIADYSKAEQTKLDLAELSKNQSTNQSAPPSAMGKSSDASNSFADAQIEQANFSLSNDTKGQFAVAAVMNKREDGYGYEKENVNYKEFFGSIQNSQPSVDSTRQEKHSAALPYDADLKTRLYADGFKMRPYSRGNTSEYYSFNFLHSNRINRDCFLIILSVFVIEIAVMWLSLSTRIAYTYFLPVLCVGAALCLLPTVIYLANPTKRTRAKFNLKMSLLNRVMIFIELSVVCILIGFFALSATVNDLDIILQSIIIPMILFTNIPLSALVYWLLYRTKKYHIA
jgi:hypothetical protein